MNPKLNFETEMRKLASIRKIESISPISGADRIEIARVGGWDVVVAKHEGHKPGDKVVYCEIDSFLPIRPEFEFLRKSSLKKMLGKEGFRLKTVKFRGQLSQGLILALKLLNTEGSTVENDKDELWLRSKEVDLHLQEGVDVTSVLDIVKYEAPVPARLQGQVAGVFPSFIQKTDEERVQNLEYDDLKGRSYYVTEKLDGSSFTAYWHNGHFGVCSRNWELIEEDENTLWKVAKVIELEDKLKKHGANIALQGELIGEFVQSNRYKIKGQSVKWFNVYNIDKRQYVPQQEFADLIQELGFTKDDCCPFLGFLELPDTMDELLIQMEGPSKLNEQQEREGVVFVFDGENERVSFKAINNHFLLQEK